MAEPTEADRERADDVARRILNGYLMQSAVRAVIAQALADERERARAPFLALAEEWSYTTWAAEIRRRAAEETGQ